MKTVPRMPSCRNVVPDAQLALRDERRHLGRGAGAARRAVDGAGPGRRTLPVQGTRGDGDHVAPAVRGVMRRPGQLPDRDAGEARLIRVDHRELVGRRSLDHLGDPGDVRALVRGQPEPEPLGVGDDVEHAAVRDVHQDRPELRHLDRHVQVRGEGGNVTERDACDLSVTACRGDPDEARPAPRA